MQVGPFGTCTGLVTRRRIPISPESGTAHQGESTKGERLRAQRVLRALVLPEKIAGISGPVVELTYFDTLMWASSSLVGGLLVTYGPRGGTLFASCLTLARWLYGSQALVRLRQPGRTDLLITPQAFHVHV